MLTREQYENKINELTNKISSINSNVRKSQTACCDNNLWNSECGNFGGIYKFDVYRPTDKNNASWKSGVIKKHNAWQTCMSNKLEQAKENLWNFQKQVAQDEQEAQIKAMREAIADQVRLEQEKIIQSEENQQIIINEPIQTTEPIKEKSIALGSLSLIGILIGGFLVLR
jgi:hypothetical protein